LLAVYLLVPYLDRAATAGRLEEGLQSAGIILLVTGAGGALGAVVRESGVGTLLAEQIVRLPLSPIMIPFIIATLIRLIQGSATVSCITTASICAPILSQIPDVNMLFAAQATASGAFFFSYFNDSFFWVANRMMGITDVKKQLVVWSIAICVPWGIAGTVIALLNLFFGAGGTLLDPLLPACILALILLYVTKKSRRR
jgi:H+/gluconate symporter-like permease